MPVTRTIQTRSSSAPGKTVRTRAWECENPVALLQISHGMCSHSAWYDEFATMLCQKGFIVVANDHLGHGITSPDDQGFFADSDGWNHVVNDMHTAMVHFKAEYPDLPCFLLGHSMGSLLTRSYLTRYGKELKGALLCGTVGPNPATAVGKALAGMLAKLRGKRYVSPFIINLAFGGYNKRIENQRTKWDWISSDSKIVDLYIADPYCGFDFTVSAMRDMFGGLAEVSRRDWAGKVPDLPILIFSGEKDPVGDYGKGVKWVADQLWKTDHDVTLKMYPQGRHEMIHEVNRQEVYQMITDWLFNLI